MKQKSHLTWLIGLSISIFSFFIATPAFALDAKVSCESLQAYDLSNIGGNGSKIISTKVEANHGKNLCTVEGLLSPAIHFQTTLPMTGWSERYLQVGCGGTCGSIRLDSGASEGCAPLENNEMVVSSTDMGHQGMGTEFGENDQQRADFAYRGVHITAVANKALIKALYGKSVEKSYFNGCSDGGREALMEAQRFPNDFDGIIAGAPAMLFQVQNSLHHGWLAMSNTGKDGKAILVASRLPILHNAVIAACDQLDGMKDGLLTDPRACHFDPTTIECPPTASDTSQCLTHAEAEAAAKIYQGAKDPTTGRFLTVGSVQYGSELAWAGVFVPTDANQPIFSKMIAEGAIQHLVFGNSANKVDKLTALAFTEATLDALRQRHPLFDAVNPDLSAFAAKGGKLILWHGWSDPHISPLTTIAYHEALIKQMGAEKAENFERLYLLPGVFHCGQGDGPSSVDLMSKMIDWVEASHAPFLIETSTSKTKANNFGQPTSEANKPAGAPPSVESPERSRPVYPYPLVASYKGNGDINQASSFEPRDPLLPRPSRDWAGKDFFTPYHFTDY
ncbi:tannase/feruloyl esterase family alpha/beta hydrolase [Leeia sp. TBRC 13508]|uniref:Tannase/feruloyl esterase family alpha/beta hydrolase n=1 Tax=Leeia speluncae TaxID=2884804 RepID=A0ABS8D8H6_9NEIS|nr:tannase/feruloyl esterase family alpha/beta hydrolase [Leeia speluncae]MCB6184522.1 tannase/feruloyl esterase family alpha/beta hydrolase [Leeia speluncae]